MKAIPFVARLSGQIVDREVVWDLPDQVEFDDAFTDVETMSFKCPVTGVDLLTKDDDYPSPALVLFYDPQSPEIVPYGICDDPAFLRIAETICNGSNAIAGVGHGSELMWWACQVALATPTFASRKYFGVHLMIEGYQTEDVFYIFEGERRAT